MAGEQGGEGQGTLCWACKLLDKQPSGRAVTGEHQNRVLWVLSPGERGWWLAGASLRVSPASLGACVPRSAAEVSGSALLWFSPSPAALRCQRNRYGDLWPRKQVPPVKHVAGEGGCAGCRSAGLWRAAGSPSRRAAGEEGAAGILALEQESRSFGRKSSCFREALECFRW